MQGIEVEGDHWPRADGHVHDRRAADEIVLAPCLAADDERRALAIAPLEHDAAAIDRPVQADRAISHAQPAARNGIERKVLPEYPGARRIAVCDRMGGPQARHAAG